MSEVIKDPAIKLFGKTIQLPTSNDDVSACPLAAHLVIVPSQPSSDRNLSCSDDKNDAAVDSKQEDGSSSTIIEDNNPIIASDASQKEEESESGSSSQDKPLKKPDKIIPCPRCNSMDTKFCYFNNYNVNQPRHFCKNCQRYWTAGGTMRNVPVGAGRRKSKNSLHHRHLVIPDGANGMIYPDAPLCESMASALNIAEKSPQLKVQHTAQVPCFPAPPWPPHTWNTAPPFLPAGFPVSIYATPPPPYWSIPWMQTPAASADHSSTSSSPSSPLGKHSRDGDEEPKVLTPKTLRIDDPNEAAKSSIWATLGIKNEKSECINSNGLFRGFKLKNDDTKSVADTSLVLQANPAALSRSLTFHESTQ